MCYAAAIARPIRSGGAPHRTWLIGSTRQLLWPSYLFLPKLWLGWFSSVLQSDADDADDAETFTFSFFGFLGSRPLRSWLFAIVSSPGTSHLRSDGDTENMDRKSGAVEISSNAKHDKNPRSNPTVGESAPELSKRRRTLALATARAHGSRFSPSRGFARCLLVRALTLGQPLERNIHGLEPHPGRRQDATQGANEEPGKILPLNEASPALVEWL